MISRLIRNIYKNYVLDNNFSFSISSGNCFFVNSNCFFFLYKMIIEIEISNRQISPEIEIIKIIKAKIIIGK